MSLTNFEALLNGEKVSPTIAQFERDFPGVAEHVAGMSRLLESSARGKITIEAGDENKVRIVLTAPVTAKAGRARVIEWTLTRDALIWSRAGGALSFPILADEWHKHKSRDDFLRGLNADVASFVHD